MTCTYLLQVDIPYRTANFPLNVLERTESKHGGMHFYLVALVPDFANVPIVVALSIGNSLIFDTGDLVAAEAHNSSALI